MQAPAGLVSCTDMHACARAVNGAAKAPSYTCDDAYDAQERQQAYQA